MIELFTIMQRGMQEPVQYPQVTGVTDLFMNLLVAMLPMVILLAMIIFILMLMSHALGIDLDILGFGSGSAQSSRAGKTCPNCEAEGETDNFCSKCGYTLRRPDV